jgi:hypothetical protein
MTTNPSEQTKTIGFRQWLPDMTFYVACVKGRVGDWEYTTRPAEAIDLSPCWQRRFAADCKAVGSDARFLSLPVSALPA